MSLQYWVCYLGYTLSFLLAMIAIIAAAFAPEAFRVPAGVAVFVFGWGGRVFYERLNAEYARLSQFTAQVGRYPNGRKLNED